MAEKKKPKFTRQDSHKKIRLAPSWRKPKGSDSKMRVGKRGYRSLVKIGWGAPGVSKNLNRQGMREVIVSSHNELESLDPKKELVLISATVGLKKKIQILSGAVKLNLGIANVKDPQKFVSDAEASRKDAQAERAKKTKDRKQAREADKKAAEKKEAEEKAKESDGKADGKSTDEKPKESAAEKEKKELDKTLITKK